VYLIRILLTKQNYIDRLFEEYSMAQYHINKEFTNAKEEFVNIKEEAIFMQQKFAEEQIQMNEFFLKEITEKSNDELLDLKQRIYEINNLVQDMQMNLILENSNFRDENKKLNLILDRKNKQIKRLKK
jgi:hypothetical protein